ncbi:MAG: hypothetical protein IJX90_06945 [Blautia sp.]|nr:hypothetical protein [Blautia sp.]
MRKKVLSRLWMKGGRAAGAVFLLLTVLCLFFPAAASAEQAGTEQTETTGAKTAVYMLPGRGASLKEITIPYIGKDGTVRSRVLQVYIPLEAEKPCPALLKTHYGIDPSSRELSWYLKEGWAVAAPKDPGPEENGLLTSDDLVFNSACYYTLRHLDEIDRTHIGMYGESAGGYICLLLNAAHVGIRGAWSSSGFCNLLFGLKEYWDYANSFNLEVLGELSPEEQQDSSVLMEKLPLPYLSGIYQSFAPNTEGFPDAEEDPAFWEAWSPCCLTECFTNPILFTHYTSDALVPVDQLTKRFTYEQAGESLPEGFRCRLSDFELPGRLSGSLAEQLPENSFSEVLHAAPSPDEDLAVPLDLTRKFNLVVLDEGPVEGYAGHKKENGAGILDGRPFFRTMFTWEWRDYFRMTREKLHMLIERYKGSSRLLPGHKDVDDTVYGSRAIYRKEVVEELRDYLAGGGEIPEEYWEEILEERPDFEKSIGSIRKKLSEKKN